MSSVMKTLVKRLKSKAQIISSSNFVSNGELLCQSYPSSFCTICTNLDKMETESHHIPVMPDEVIDIMEPKSGNVIVYFSL